MNIALLGFGTVGQGVYQIIEKTDGILSPLHIRRILIRAGKEKIMPIMTDDYNMILTDKNIDIVVEVMGGLEPAHTYILSALKNGKHVVTANKAVVAAHMEEFLDTASKYHVSFMFEASTGGGIPWISSIHKVRRIDTITGLYGIFNGTTNYILDHMTRYALEFTDILKQAQELGYAEKDPSADIDGWDIKNKLQISMALAFDFVPCQGIPTFGIRTITQNDISYFKSIHKTVRLIAQADKTKDNCFGIIEPMLFSSFAMEAHVPDNFNLACVHGATIGDLKFYGQGAGMLPTANAVIQDILDIIEEQTSSITLNKALTFHTNTQKKTYIIRTNAKHEALKEIQPAAWKNSAYYSLSLTAWHAHQLIQQLLKQDSTSFMASVKEDV